jgi:hypothetical protein
VDSNGLLSIFPKTIELLHERRIAYLQSQFHKALVEDLMIANSSDQSRWFPVFLKFQGIRKEILEVAEFEYLQNLVKVQDHGKKKTDEGQVHLNPSAQFVELHHDQPKLGRKSGLYCFFKKNDHFYEFKMEIPHALVVDLIHEGRKYSKNQLSEMSKHHVMGSHRSVEDWLETIEEMICVGILIL